MEFQIRVHYFAFGPLQPCRFSASCGAIITQIVSSLQTNSILNLKKVLGGVVQLLVCYLLAHQAIVWMEYYYTVAAAASAASAAAA